MLGCDSQRDLEYDDQDPQIMIECIDSSGKFNIRTLHEYREYVNYLIQQSKYIGDTWSWYALTCRSLDLMPFPSGRFLQLLPSATKTGFPIRFIGNNADPETPLRDAYKASSAFPNSVLAQNSVGHTSLSAPSNCTIAYVQAYFASILPPANVACQSNEVPFRSTLSGLAGLSELGKSDIQMDDKRSASLRKLVEESWFKRPRI